MLPFLAKPRKADGGVITEHRQPDKEQSGNEQAMDAASKDIIDAIKSNDIKRLSKALMSAFQIADSEPHIEGEHQDQE